jgi:hypothetical protein
VTAIVAGCVRLSSLTCPLCQAGKPDVLPGNRRQLDRDERRETCDAANGQD